MSGVEVGPAREISPGSLKLLQSNLEDVTY